MPRYPHFSDVAQLHFRTLMAPFHEIDLDIHIYNLDLILMAMRSDHLSLPTLEILFQLDS